MEIRTKAEFFRLWNDGLLGYKLRTWDTLDAYREASNRPSIVAFRQIGVAGGGAFAICENLTAVEQTAAEWTAAGRKFMICEAAPDEKATIQGEVCRTTKGLEGFLGASKLRMRDAIARGILKPRTPVETKVLLDTYMSPPSRDDLDALLELYPDATIEFTCYGGHNFERGRNTIFWEVRNY